jgi:hypothetical protein
MSASITSKAAISEPKPSAPALVADAFIDVPA